MKHKEADVWALSTVSQKALRKFSRLILIKISVRNMLWRCATASLVAVLLHQGQGIAAAGDEGSGKRAGELLIFQDEFTQLDSSLWKNDITMGELPLVQHSPVSVAFLCPCQPEKSHVFPGFTPVPQTIHGCCYVGLQLSDNLDVATLAASTQRCLVTSLIHTRATRLRLIALIGGGITHAPHDLA
jgi:hypothetical protein